MANKDSILFRLFKNKLATISVGFIVLTILVALFAYPIAPDSSPDANSMIVELSARPAGFQHQFLKLPKEKQPNNSNLLKRIFQGTPSNYNLIPINGFSMNDSSIVLRHYVDENLEDTLVVTKQQLKQAKAWTPEGIEAQFITHKKFYLGTDRYGRDILSRLLVGSRVSIAVGFISVILSLSIGIILGSLAGWYGGRIDDGVMWLVNILWSIPTLLLVFAITLTIGKGFFEIFIAIGLTSWVSAARLIRGQVMQVKEMDYISAAKVLGFSNNRIIYRHILPNIAGPVMVIGAANFATAILVEAGLSFLGIGVQPPTPSWGLMIKEHYNFLIAGNPLPALIPGIAIMLLVLAFNILGNALRDAIDVKMN